MLSFGWMFTVSMVSALLSSMFVWADKLSDIRLSINDFYMAFLMTGWMFVLEGALTAQTFYTFFGLALLLLSFYAIRTQLFVTKNQYIQGMIPHHSMAIHMSRKLIQKYGDSVVAGLPGEIIKAQENEIRLLKSFS
jgi:hypothetical protein